MSPESLRPGDRVRVRQTILGGAMHELKCWTIDVEGLVVSCEAEPTGSWFAHGKHDRVWLLRLRLKKDDGEIAVLNLDDASVVMVLSRGPAAAAAS